MAAAGLALRAAAATTHSMNASPTPAAPEPFRITKGRIRQSAVWWCFKPMTVDELAGHAADLGMPAIELVPPEEWPKLRQRGLTCALAPSHGFAKGFAHREEHAECLAMLHERIDQAAAAGVPSVITFSGFRRGLSWEEGGANMVSGLRQIAGHAEKQKVTVCLEMLNSRVNAEMRGHPDYFCDDIDAAVEICRTVGSERIKVLFDIYHVQIMHGDIISRIRQHHQWIGHYHTAGNPGRAELDARQELNYATIMYAIKATGYRGFIGHEFIPTRDPVAGLTEAVRLCDV